MVLNRRSALGKQEDTFGLMSKLTVAKKDVEKASIARGFAESEWLVEQMSKQSDSIPAFPVSYRQGLP